MGRNCFAAVFLFIFIVADFSSASLLSKHRILIGEPTNDKSPVPGKESPVASPPPPPSLHSSGSDPKPVDDPNKQKTDSPLPTETPTAVPAPNGLNTGTKKEEGKDPKDPNPAPVKALEKDPNRVPDSTPKDNPSSNNEQEPGSGSQPLDGGKEKDKEGSPKGGKAKNKENLPEGGTTKNKENLPEGGKTKNKDDPPEGRKEKNKEDLPEGGNGKNKDVEKKDDNVTNSPNADKESCRGGIKKCKAKDVVACIKSYDSGSKEVAIRVENIGNSTLKANLLAENTNKTLKIRKHQYEKVNISLDIDKSTNITLNFGNEECVLHMDPPVSDGNVFARLPSYEKVVTPINGAYFLIVTVLIFGGTWACCKVRMRKQRTGGGVPYQELEMGLPESVSATAVETAEGWDQGWDDDWDGDNAVRSPGGHIAGSISANGLTSRTTNKDGWENDWDD